MNSESIRAHAANRRAALREAFMRHDPQFTGKVAPFLVREVISAQRVDVLEESVAKYMHHGRFEWMLFCDALERELMLYFKKEGIKLAGAPTSGASSPRGGQQSPRNMRGGLMQMGNPLQSPRRLPALLRTADSRSPRAPGFMSATLSPRASVQSMSPRGEMMQSM